MKALTRATTAQKGGGLKVDKIDSGAHNISPEVRRNKSTKEKGTSSLQDITMLAFNHPVLRISART